MKLEWNIAHKMKLLCQPYLKRDFHFILIAYTNFLTGNCDVANGGVRRAFWYESMTIPSHSYHFLKDETPNEEREKKGIVSACLFEIYKAWN